MSKQLRPNHFKTFASHITYIITSWLTHTKKAQTFYWLICTYLTQWIWTYLYQVKWKYKSSPIRQDPRQSPCAHTKTKYSERKYTFGILFVIVPHVRMVYLRYWNGYVTHSKWTLMRKGWCVWQWLPARITYLPELQFFSFSAWKESRKYDICGYV